LLIVERVVKVFPQLQVTAISVYFGCVSIFIVRCLPIAGPALAWRRSYRAAWLQRPK